VFHLEPSPRSIEDIEFLLFSGPFCGTSSSEPPFLKFYFNIFDQEPSTKSISVIEFPYSGNHILTPIWV
jgi:hypothetical protein